MSTTTTTPTARPQAAVVAGPTAWKSIPGFLRFTAWVAAILFIASLVIGGIFGSVIVGSILNAITDSPSTSQDCPAGMVPAGVTGACAPKGN